MRKTKRRKKISKFTNKKKGGMLRLRGMLGPRTRTRTTAITIPPFGTILAAIVILDNITNLIVQNDFANMDKMKGDIFEMTTIVGELSNSEKIEFVEIFNTTFNANHKKYPVVMELYFTQIITIIYANLSGNFLSFESRQIAKLCNASMIMIVNAFEASSPATPNILTPSTERSLQRKYFWQVEDFPGAIKLNIIKLIISPKYGFDMNVIKHKILKMINMFKEESNSDKIAFMEALYYDFDEYYKLNPVAMELYFTQIITIIDANLSGNFLSPKSSRLAKIANFLSPEVMQLKKLSHDIMIKVVTKFKTSQSSLSVPLEIAQRSSQSAPIELLGGRMSVARE